MTVVEQREIGADRERRDGPAKVTGTAPYAAEHPFADRAYAHAVQATVARGTITAIDTRAAAAVAGVITILTHQNAERLASDEDKELWVLQSPEVWFRGQFVAVVIAGSAEVGAGGRRTGGDRLRLPRPRCRAAGRPSGVLCARACQPGIPDRHRGRRRRGEPRVCGGQCGRDLHHAGLPQQPDGAAHHGRTLGSGGRAPDAARLHAERPSGAGADRAAVRPRRRAGDCDRAAHRRRLRL